MTEPPAENNSSLTLQGDVRKIVCFGEGKQSPLATLKADVKDLQKAMSELGAQAKEGEIRVDLYPRESKYHLH